YDQLRAGGYRPGDEVPPAGFGPGGPAGFDYDDVFAGGGAGGGFSDFFESLFRRQANGGGPRARGPGGPAGPGMGDTRARLAGSLETVYRGDSVRIGVDGRSFDVRVPAGVRPGQVIRLARQGSLGGNLLLEIEYAAHPQFEVDGRNIIHVLQVAPWEAALCATVSVRTLGGRVELKIPAGSEAGRKLRLRGRGLPGAGGAPAGDQLVELEIQSPAPRDDEQREAYERLRDAFGGEWRRN